MQVNLGTPPSTTLKIFLIGAIVLILQIPLQLLNHLMSERAGLRDQAYEKVAQGWGGAPTVGGPLLVIPTLVGDSSNAQRDYVYVLPRALDVSIDSKREAQPRYVGIYEVPVFLADFKITASFDLDTQLPQLAARYPNRTFLWQQATLGIPISDLRSMRQLSNARFDNDAVTFSPVGRSTAYHSLETPVRLDPQSKGQRSFEMQLTLAGSRGVSVLPLGSTTQVRMQSDWPHPSFKGAFLPGQRSIGPQGFEASWQVLELNRNFGQMFGDFELQRDSLEAAAFGVDMHQSIDIYQQGERAIKYGALFIALTFLTFFAWEFLSKMSLHPLQYLLIGLAMSIFYLLLIALSEHVAFALAYWVSAAALVALIGIYLAGALRTQRRGVVAATAIALVYGVLYVLVLSEDYALLMGALLLFTALGAVMLATRKVDWYAITPPQDTAARPE